MGRPKVPKRDYSGITDDPEMLKTLQGTSTLGKQATQSTPKHPVQVNEKTYLMDQWSRVDKARAVQGRPSLPKPGSRAYRE